MAYRKRVFLNPIALGVPSFIQAIADSSRNGEDALGTYVLIIADCERRILLEFGRGNEKQRKISLAKIDRLVKVVNDSVRQFAPKQH